jgi:hypothetical protein
LYLFVDNFMIHIRIKVTKNVFNNYTNILIYLVIKKAKCQYVKIRN